ncbi:MAG: hypothetical protein JXR69_09455 [Candidatus Delongbacteria bacterium]|nr:hypothetical protein [Candidatus Delongbacteria bacterium]
MKILNEKKYTVLIPSKDLLGEDGKNFILECDIEIAKHNSEVYVFDFKSVDQADSSVLAFLVSTFCSPKNSYYCINVNPSLLDIFQMMQLLQCMKLLDKLEDLKI